MIYFVAIEIHRLDNLKSMIMKILSKSKIVISYTPQYKDEPNKLHFCALQRLAWENMDEYNGHYHQLILIIIIIINWYKYNPFTWMAPLGWLVGFLEYFVSISSRILPPIISYFDKNFILFLWSLIYISQHILIFPPNAASAEAKFLIARSWSVMWVQAIAKKNNKLG